MSEWEMEDPVGPEKLVELKYKVIDAKTKGILTSVDFPIGYVHGVNQILAPKSLMSLKVVYQVTSSRCRSTVTSYLALETKTSFLPTTLKMCLRSTERSVLQY